MFITELADPATALLDASDVIKLVTCYDLTNIGLQKCLDPRHAAARTSSNIIGHTPLHGNAVVRLSSFEPVCTLPEFADVVPVLDAELTNSTRPLCNSAYRSKLLTIDLASHVHPEVLKNPRFTTFSATRPRSRTEHGALNATDLS